MELRQNLRHGPDRDRSRVRRRSSRAVRLLDFSTPQPVTAHRDHSLQCWLPARAHSLQCWLPAAVCLRTESDNRVSEFLAMNPYGLHFIPEKIANQQAVMYLGPVAILGHMVIHDNAMCRPHVDRKLLADDSMRV